MTPDDLQPTMGGAVEMTRWRRFVVTMEIAATRLRRKLPYLVWHGDEVDVRVTLKDLGALGGEASRVWDAQATLNDMGISFDTGSGFHGRDWEWDWSLRGPISVSFRGRARNPERRLARPKPKLVVNNERPA